MWKFEWCRRGTREDQWSRCSRVEDVTLLLYDVPNLQVKKGGCMWDKEFLQTILKNTMDCGISKYPRESELCPV